MKNPQIGDRVHWNTGKGAGLFGRIVAVQAIPANYGTMCIEWDAGEVSRHLPQSLLISGARWSYQVALAEAA